VVVSAVSICNQKVSVAEVDPAGILTVCVALSVCVVP